MLRTLHSSSKEPVSNTFFMIVFVGFFKGAGEYQIKKYFLIA